MIVYRNKNPKKKGDFIITDKGGDVVKDKKILEYIKSLVIPPAYDNVSIFIEKSKTPKILFEGYDDKGRKQQIYSAQWRKRADKEKFKSLIEFGEMLPKINSDIDKHIKSKRLTKNKIISLILRIISICYFRIGNQKYETLYGSYGISNITKKHIKSTKGNVEIEFIGKKGVKNHCIITDNSLKKEILNIINNKKSGDYVFDYTSGGETLLIKATDINDWLKKYNSNFTTKMFRTFDANTLFIEHMEKIHKDESPQQISLSKRKKNVVESMKDVSECINNSPAICKKSYMLMDLINTYIETPKKYKRLFLNSKSARTNFINFLKDL